MSTMGRPKNRYYVMDRAKDQSTDLMRASGTVRWAIVDRLHGRSIDEQDTKHDALQEARMWNQGHYAEHELPAGAAEFAPGEKVRTQGRWSDVTAVVVGHEHGDMYRIQLEGKEIQRHKSRMHKIG